MPDGEGLFELKGNFGQRKKGGKKISHKYIHPGELSSHLSSKRLQHPLGWSHRHNLWDLKVEPGRCVKRSEWQGCLALTRQGAPNGQVLLSKKPMKMETRAGFAVWQPFCQLAAINRTECTENFHSWLSDPHPVSPLKLLPSCFTITLQWKKVYNHEDCASVVINSFSYYSWSY